MKENPPPVPWVNNKCNHRGPEFTENSSRRSAAKEDGKKMRHFSEDITSSVNGREEPAQDEDGLTAEEKTQLRKLCVLIVISEFLENYTETQN